MSAIEHIQVLVYSTLSQYNPLKEMVTGIYIDEAKETAVSPYVVTGELTMVDDGTKTRGGEDFTITLHVWESTSSYKCKQIMGKVKEALSQKLTVNGGFSLWFNQVEFMSVIKDPSGWQHGVLRVRLKIEE